jgi:hypothetical protein
MAALRLLILYTLILLIEAGQRLDGGCFMLSHINGSTRGCQGVSSF